MNIQKILAFFALYGNILKADTVVVVFNPGLHVQEETSRNWYTSFYIGELKIEYDPGKISFVDTVRQYFKALFGFIVWNLFRANLLILCASILWIFIDRNFASLKSLKRFLSHNYLSILRLIFSFVEPIIYRSNSYGLVMFAKLLPSHMSWGSFDHTVYPWLTHDFRLNQNQNSCIFFNTTLTAQSIARGITSQAGSI